MGLEEYQEANKKKKEREKIYQQFGIHNLQKSSFCRTGRFVSGLALRASEMFVGNTEDIESTI